MSEALKEAKVTRRNGKAALTRAGKSLRHTIESKRPGTEVRESLAKVQEAYEKLTQKHEELTKLIEDDEERGNVVRRVSRNVYESRGSGKRVH